MKNRENEMKQPYICFLIAGLLVLSISGVLLSNHMLGKVLRFQKNIIGVLQEEDEAHVQIYLQAMFETVNDSVVEKGEAVLHQHGYTDAGIYFIAEKMGMLQSVNFAVLCFILLIVVVVFCFYRITKIQKKELEFLCLENDKLREYQMKEEYISNQNKRMQSFIENVAHQMKTPLSRVYTSMDIVEDSLVDNEAKYHVEECYQHLDSMNVLMRRLMDIGRLEAGKVIFQKKLLIVKELLKELEESFKAEKSRIHIDCEKRIEFYGDEKWLKEALLNILTNALEADSSKGTVELSCTKSADYIKLSVRDHGPGLSEKDIPNIFDRFYLPEHVKQNHTGIGLNLAKLIVEGHQGSIYVYNHAEGGAVFQIILPIYESLKMRE